MRILRVQMLQMMNLLKNSLVVTLEVLLILIQQNLFINLALQNLFINLALQSLFQNLDLHDQLIQKNYHQDQRSTWHRLARSTTAGETVESFVLLTKSFPFRGALNALWHCDSGRSPLSSRGTTMRIGTAHVDAEMHVKFQLAANAAASF